MQIDIQTQDFPLTNVLRSYAERRLRVALTCCDEHIQRIGIQLSDINRPSGGVGKRCHLRVVLTGLPDMMIEDVVIEDVEIDIYVAIDRATARAGRALVREIHRQQSLLRQDRYRDRARNFSTNPLTN